MNKYPILILHGWNLSAVKFKPLGDEFRKRGYKVLCPDLPGFGVAPKPKSSLYLSDYISFIKKYLIENKIDRVVLVGHSFGGRIGIKFAAENPKLLHALILTGTPGINPIPAAKISFFLVLTKLGKFALSLPGLSFMQNISRKLLYKMAGANDFYNTDEKMRETFKNVIKEILLPYLNQIDISTLLIWGAEDKIVPINIAQQMKKLIEGAKLVIIPDARHGLPWTHPKLFAEEVERFLEGI
jgi:pimeloyl-ACP methyl ester carboxylesterase